MTKSDLENALKRGKEYGARFCSRKCYGRFLANNPERFPMTKTRRGRGGYREDLGKYFRSSWEANYARYLNWLIELNEIESWEYETETFEFNSIKRGSKFYTPDFKVIEKNGNCVYHEIKGYMDQRSKTKLDRMARHYPDIKIIIIDEDAYYAIAEDVCQFIPNWEKRR